jgi:hypothetical protein
VEPSDTGQFQSLSDAANDIVEGHDSALISPMETSRWFSLASKDVLELAAQSEQRAGPHPSKELQSTLVDLRILANLASYHANRIPAGLSMALYQKTHDLNALDDAISHEKSAMQAWQGIVKAAGDVYNLNLTMGFCEADLCGSWRDELVKLQSGLEALEKQRAEYVLESRREVGRYDLGTGPVQPGFQRSVLRHQGSGKRPAATC